LEDSFRQWADDSPRADIRKARYRILLIFLLIRYTGAKLQEVLSLDLHRDINYNNLSVMFCGRQTKGKWSVREVPVSELLLEEIRLFAASAASEGTDCHLFAVDPAFVRRKFYERAVQCGFPKELGSPEMIRKARGAELMHGRLPLPAVQRLLGHSTPNLTSAFISFSDDDIQKISKHFIDAEASRRSSARNHFFGKIHEVKRGDIQSVVELITLDQNKIIAVITNDSIERLALRVGSLVTAEVKAPWVILAHGKQKPICSAENLLRGEIARVVSGEIMTEYVIRISEQTEICSVITTTSSRYMNLKVGDDVWVFFHSYAIVLHTD
jgi:molybdate transport system regulatory protein